jgi:hypothetical protein
MLTITSVEGFATQNSTSDSLYLESEDPSTLSSRLTSTIFGTAQDNSALITTFSYVPAAAVPGPTIGAGLPGLITACAGLLAWWHGKRRAQAAA